MMFKFICLVILYGAFCDGAQFVNLNGDWRVSDTTNKYVDIKATVPGGIYTDLMNNGVIEDIFYGYGDTDLKWIPRLNWTYYRNFSITDDVLYQDNINLVFDGLDTFSSIYVNDQEVGISKNMFVQYIFDVKKLLKPGNNEIQIKFLSPITVSANLGTEQDKNYTIPPNCPPSEYNGECYKHMIRKMQSSFAWDWGPSFPSVGIWKNVFLEAYNESLIRYVVSDISEEDEDHWNVNIDVYLAANKKKSVNGKLVVELETNFTNITKVIDVKEESNSNDEIVSATTLEILKTYVNNWWPNGYGSSQLYNLKITFKSTDETDTSIRTSRIGFRKIELIQDKLESGLTFYFKVNDVPIFMKGSNEIPIDVLPERGQNKSKIKKLLTDARDSYMNMIRVWGGGVYESDYFYEMADELGILIWQDFMFACSMYPTRDAFLENVLVEVRHQVKRLYSHASVALFSGNNENEAALRQNWYGTGGNYSVYYNDYVKLYVDTIKTEFFKISHNRGIFITSSPTNGKQSDEEGYVAENPSSSLYGDTHFYNYILDPFNPNFYPVPRFSSEYGYQSLPSVQSWNTVTNNSNDISIDSVFMNHRQHLPLGNLILKAILLFYFDVPSTSAVHFNEAFIYYTQISQALAIKIETEHYRRYRGIFNEKGEGNTMGALYWQLNDVWIAPSWSGIDHLGRWKMLQYYAQNFFAPVIVTGLINTQRTLEVYLVSDLVTPLLEMQIEIKVYQWNSFNPVHIDNITVNSEVGSSNLVKSIEVDYYLSSLGCGSLVSARNNCFFYLSVNKDGVKVTPDNFVFPNAVKDANITIADVKINSVTKINENGEYSVELTTDQIALFVWLESMSVEGRFSENGFLLVESKRIVYFKAEVETTEEDLLKTLTVTHLVDKKYSKIK